MADSGKKQTLNSGLKDGSPPLNSWFDVHIYPSADGLSVYFRDVTERRMAEEEREQLIQVIQDINEQLVMTLPLA